MAKHTPTPWQRSGIRVKSKVGGVETSGHQIGPDSDPIAMVYYSDETDALHHETLANATFIVTAVNNHAPMLKSLEHCAQLFDTLAQTMDRWAIESRQGGWSTHQVDENRKRADDCRRYAAQIRSALPSDQRGTK